VVVVGLTVVVVAPVLVVGLTVVVVAPVVVVGLTVVVVAPVVVVGFTVVVVAPVLVVGLTVVVVSPELVVGLTVVVVVPPEVVAEANCPTLTPANTIRATATSKAAVRFRTFFACLAMDPYLLISRDRCIALAYRTNKQPPLGVLQAG
jgi:hypothetical protein